MSTGASESRSELVLTADKLLIIKDKLNNSGLLDPDDWARDIGIEDEAWYVIHEVAKRVGAAGVVLVHIDMRAALESMYMTGFTMGYEIHKFLTEMGEDTNHE